MNSYRILVCGGRNYNNFVKMNQVLTELCDRLNLWESFFTEYYCSAIIISGMAHGADTLAIEWAISNNATVEKYPADWNKYGPAAGPIRNQQMLDEGLPNIVIAFPGGRGTLDMINRARKAEIEVIEIE